jgi:hypothetical protein
MAGKGQNENEILVHQTASKRDECLEDARGLDVRIKPIIGGGN